MGFLDKIMDATNGGLNSVINVLPAKSVIVKQATSVDYEKLLFSLNTISETVPASTKLVVPIQLLNEASIRYNQSDSEMKDDEFINYLVDNIDAEQILSEIEPVAQYIPNGNYIVMVLRFIINLKKKK